MEVFIVVAAIAGLAFCITQFIDLMRRSDDQFAGRFDKPIWAAAILLTNVVGASVYFICRPDEAPQSNRSLPSELARAKSADGPPIAG
jgi:hypothetical protein